MLLKKHFWFSRHFALPTQLQVLDLVMVLGLVILWLCELKIFYGTCCEVGNAYLIKTGSFFQLLWQHLQCMVGWAILHSFSGFWWWWYFMFFRIAFRVYTLFSLVPHCIASLSSWICLRLPITVIILILLILAPVWLWTVDGWTLCWHKLFYYLLGKDGMLSFLNSKWYLGNSRLSYCNEL